MEIHLLKKSWLSGHLPAVPSPKVVVQESLWCLSGYFTNNTAAGVINSMFVWISKEMKIFNISLAKIITSIFNQKQQQNDAFYLQNKMFTKDFKTMFVSCFVPALQFAHTDIFWMLYNLVHSRTDTEPFEINIFLFLSFQKLAKLQFTFNENRICAACLITPSERVDSGGRV